MPPKKSHGTGKSTVASTPKTRARTTQAQQPLNEEIEVQQGEKEQPIDLDKELDVPLIVNQINELREHGLELQTSVNDIRNHLVAADNNHESLNQRLEDILTYLQANPRRTEDTNTSIGSPHRQTRIGFLLDTSGTITTVDESTAFEKDFPQFGIIIYALTTYGAIRTLFDVDHTGIGAGIFVHVKNLTRWHHVNGFPLGAVRSYFVAHFRKHQRSKDPSVWMNIDFELYANHIRHTAPQFLQPSRPNSPSKMPRTGNPADVCINFNTEGKGCTWGLCQRKHVCSNCGDNKHARQQCTKKPSSVKQ